MKGCLWRRSKVALHMLAPIEGMEEKPLDIAIADMSCALLPHLTIVDGSVGLEGIGPSAGTPIVLDVALAGADAFAVDAVACRLMGTDAERIPHLRLGAARGYGIIDMEHISVSPENWEQWRRPFAPPPTDISIGFPQFTILDKNSCSACQSSLLLFLKRYGETILDYFPKGEKITFAIGKGHEIVSVDTLCIGNCTARNIAQGRFLGGCPPVGSEILRFISGQVSIDEKDAKPDE